MIILKNKNLIRFGSLILILFLGTLPFFAQAIDLFTPMVKALLTITNSIMYIVGKIGSILISLGALFINLTIDLNSEILTSKLVHDGFNISLSVANLGFVLLIIVIAIATILRAQTYAAKELLWKLILIAFLVNFSLAIAGLFIDFSGILTQFFINAASPENYKNLVDNLVAAFGAQKFLIPTDDTTALEKMGISGGLLTLLLSLATPFFVAIFTVMMAVVLIGTGALFLIRYIYLSILLILMPIAWMLWVFPAFQDQWKAWWNKFIQYTFFMPAAAFFIYLTILANNKMGSKIASMAESEDTTKFLVSQNLAFDSPAATIMQMLVTLGLLVGGLIAAQGMGIAGASVALNAAKAAGQATGRWAGKIATKPVAWGVGWGAGRAASYALRKGGMVDKLSTQLAKLPLGIGRKASIAAANLVASRAKAVEEAQKELTNVPTDPLIDQAKRLPPGTNPVLKAAYANELAKRKALTEEKLGEDKYKEFIKAAGDMGATKDVFASRPDAVVLTNEFQAKIEKAKKEGKSEKEIEAERKNAIGAVVGKMTVEDVLKISPKAIPNIFEAFNPAQLRGIATRGSAQLRDALRAVKPQNTIPSLSSPPSRPLSSTEREFTLEQLGKIKT